MSGVRMDMISFMTLQVTNAAPAAFSTSFRARQRPHLAFPADDPAEVVPEVARPSSRVTPVAVPPDQAEVLLRRGSKLNGELADVDVGHAKHQDQKKSPAKQQRHHPLDPAVKIKPRARKTDMVTNEVPPSVAVSSKPLNDWRALRFVFSILTNIAFIIDHFKYLCMFGDRSNRHIRKWFIKLIVYL